MDPDASSAPKRRRLAELYPELASKQGHAPALPPATASSTNSQLVSQAGEFQTDDTSAADIPSDAMAAVVLLRREFQQAQRAAAAAATAAAAGKLGGESGLQAGPLLLKEHVYTLLRDRTQADQALDQMRRTNTVRWFKLPTGADEAAIMLTQDYVALLEAAAARQLHDNCQTVGSGGHAEAQQQGAERPVAAVSVFLRLAKHVLPRCVDVSISRSQLLLLLATGRAPPPLPPTLMDITSLAGPPQAAGRVSPVSSNKASSRLPPLPSKGLVCKADGQWAFLNSSMAGAQLASLDSNKAGGQLASLSPDKATARVGHLTSKGLTDNAASQLASLSAGKTIGRVGHFTSNGLTGNAASQLASLSPGKATGRTGHLTSKSLTGNAASQLAFLGPGKAISPFIAKGRMNQGAARVAAFTSKDLSDKGAGRGVAAKRPASRPLPRRSAVEEEELSALLTAGFLTRHPLDDATFFFCVPDMGPWVKSISSGRKELLGLLSRRKYGEVKESELLCRVALRSSMLGTAWHARDLLGKGLAKRLPTTCGAVLKLVQR